MGRLHASTEQSAPAAHVQQRARLLGGTYTFETLREDEGRGDVSKGSGRLAPFERQAHRWKQIRIRHKRILVDLQGSKLPRKLLLVRFRGGELGHARSVLWAAYDERLRRARFG